MRTPRPSQSLRKLPRRLVPLAVTTALVVSGGLLAAPATASGAPRTAPTTASAPASGTAHRLEPAREPGQAAERGLEARREHLPQPVRLPELRLGPGHGQRGSINYCVRWDSDGPVTAAQRDQIHTALQRSSRSGWT